LIFASETSPRSNYGAENRRRPLQRVDRVSRKYAIPLLEYLDRERVTKRVGDERMIL
jgi:hypothetical protein